VFWSDYNMSRKCVVIYSSHATYAVNFLAKAASMECNVVVVTPRDIPFQNGDHPTCYSELQKDIHIKTLQATEKPPERIDHIFVLLTQLHFYDTKEYELLKKWLNYADSVGLICNSWPEDLRQRLARELKSILKYTKLMLRSRSIGYEYAPSTTELLSIWRRWLIGCGPHPRYFHEEGICKMLYSSWDLMTQRPIKFNFLGTEAPARRKNILNDIRHCLANTVKPNIQIINSYHSMNRGDNLLALIRATPIDKDIPRPPEEYLQLLSDSDFTLCIPGYTIWSCRPYESLLRGSVPILDEREKRNYLDIELVDKKNCILVYHENWPRAIKYALELNQLQIVEMRRSVQITVESSINLVSWSRTLMQKMGVYPRN
jgi:hypothetical protein